MDVDLLGTPTGPKGFGMKSILCSSTTSTGTHTRSLDGACVAFKPLDVQKF